MTSQYTQLHRNTVSTHDVTIRTLRYDVIITVPINITTKMKTYGCPTCDKIYQSRWGVVRHSKICRRGINFKCHNRQCTKVFPSLDNMVVHHRTCYIAESLDGTQGHEGNKHCTAPEPDAGPSTLETPTATNSTPKAHTTVHEPPEAHTTDEEEDRALISFLRSIAVEGHEELPDINLLLADDDQMETTPRWSPLSTPSDEWMYQPTINETTPGHRPLHPTGNYSPTTGCIKDYQSLYNTRKVLTAAARTLSHLE